MKARILHRSTSELRVNVSMILAATMLTFKAIADYQMIAGCVGPQSDAAGKADSCAGCPNQNVCASGAAKQKDPGKYARRFS